ncbi:MAG: glycosyltransferase family 2 protein [Ignavibacteriaceae bacterium]|jgi:hypothetical protein
MDEKRVTSELKKVGVIIPTYNNTTELFECISSLLLSNYKNCTIVIVDDGSRNEIQEQILTKFKHNSNIKVICNKANDGFARVCNLGTLEAKKSQCDLYFFLNNDTLVKENTITLMVKEFSSVDVGIVGPKIILYNSGKLDSTGGFLDRKTLDVNNRGYNALNVEQDQKVEKVDFVSGCALMIRADLFEKVKGFDERFFLYSEEVDLCYSVTKSNYKVIYSPFPIVWHHHSKTIGENPYKKSYYLIRSKIFFVKKWGTKRQVLNMFIKQVKNAIMSSTIQYMKQVILLGLALFDGISNNMRKSKIKWLN